ncbi:LysR family transcriptional regulator [Pseudothauera rhizosphaerae]|uniref:LysR family transcriptional regulator n=1 Tax=Pseudothauera rhizosphaerae TaxID=2565932 RepID=A0A4S4AMB3_9RHOO|nr:LysR family transcriptional regulator [Pseudothauera rhizosphaerae]THF60636.1 LysR family transcriptional regulator [Pseudothauera rhizosphaerae]
MIRHWTLQQLRLFEAVARHRSFTRAAGELHLTQPAVSIQVKRLEESIGLPLFEQVGKRLFLTRAGEEVFAAAGDVVGRLRGLAGTVADMKGKVAGPLKVAAVSSTTYFMPDFLGRFLRAWPEVQPQLTVTNRSSVVERLAGNEDDFVIMGGVPERLPLAVHPFLENPLVPIAHPDHPLARETHIPLARFAAERFLMREQGSGTRAATERLFAAHGLEAQVYIELGSSEAIKHGVMAGLGVSVMSRSGLGLELETGRIVQLPVEGLPLARMWHAVHLAGKRLSLTAATFLDFLLREGRAT